MMKQKTHEESEQYTWISQLSNIRKMKVKLLQGYSIEPLHEKDKSCLAELYYASYQQTTTKNLADTEAEIERDFRNEFGILDFFASFLIFYNNIAVAAILVVEQAPWEDTPSCPFITQVMVHPDYRKLGLAQYLVQKSANVLSKKGARSVALRVMSDNTKACNLYRKCGFVNCDCAAEVI